MPTSIRTAFTPIGNIEAAVLDAGVIRRVVVCARTAEIIDQCNVYPGTALHRSLVRAAREAWQSTGRGVFRDAPGSQP